MLFGSFSNHAGEHDNQVVNKLVEFVQQKEDKPNRFSHIHGELKLLF